MNLDLFFHYCLLFFPLKKLEIPHLSYASDLRSLQLCQFKFQLPVYSEKVQPKARRDGSIKLSTQTQHEFIAVCTHTDHHYTSDTNSLSLDQKLSTLPGLCTAGNPAEWKALQRLLFFNTEARILKNTNILFFH